MIQHPIYTLSYEGINYRVLRRTFEAAKYPKGSEERSKLNLDSYTSEYYTSMKYELRWETDNYPYPHKRQFRTKKEAIDAIPNQITMTST